MIAIDLTNIILIGATWLLNKGTPAVFHWATDPHRVQVQQAKHLCDEHNDCEAEKAQAMQGLKPVIRLEEEKGKTNEQETSGVQEGSQQDPEKRGSQ